MPNSDFFLLAGFTGIVAWIVTLLTNLYAFSQAEQLTTQTARRVARTLGRMAVFHAVLGGILLVVAGCVLISFMPYEHYEDEWVFGWLASSLSGAIAFVSAGVQWRQTQRLRRVSMEEIDDLQAIAIGCRSARNWVLLGQSIWALGFLVLVPPLAFLVLLVTGIGVPIAVISVQNRRPSQLLWALAVAVKHGRNLSDELRIVAATSRPSYRTRLRRLAELLDDGDDLGLALRKVPNVLPPWTVAAIRTAEETGCLSVVLPQLAKRHLDQLNWSYERTGISGLLSYGAAYFTAFLSIVGFLMMFIVPKYKAIFDGFGTELPKVTIFLIQVTDWMAAYWFLLTPCVGILALVLMELVRSDASRGQHLRYGFLHRLYLVLDGPDILRQLAQVVDRHKPLHQGLSAIAQHHFRPSIRKSLTIVSTAAERGVNPFVELQQQGFATKNDVIFLTTAQQAGNLAWALRELAEIRERRAAHRHRVWSEFLSPIPVMATGLIVLLIAAAFFMPLVKLLNDLS